ncbi:hypothetical protein TTHERM_00079330 (macronuclear) [Tetrahymena thermophila SB210]|uniref:Uncharacterized protein n=1 Tax=Tetrahymena thermophila (strain SB210) TaxID=312017 RepID=Q23FT1_TETTS|nr:hypothetical protein TTHERM_00079330 [Tetrahymena thermophila SB210]EAR95529.2 hypothetical protein TTHERM_00079330 [Tetrahymena thermophila SB210]|eukprot:XP_001015774.2 hypothetical protein TTHERM_00079330 [Tetrahymena thermophila SB210]
MEQNQQYQIRVSGLPLDIDVDSYSGLFGSNGKYKIIKKYEDNQISNKSNASQQLVLQYESLQVAQATIKEIKSQNSNLSAELIALPQQQQNDQNASTRQENQIMISKVVQQDQAPNSSSQKLSSSKSRSRSNSPKNIHNTKSNQVQFSTLKNKGDIQLNSNGLSIVVDKDNSINSGNQYQFGYNSMLSQQIQDINGQNSSNSQHFKDVSPQKAQASKVKSSESRERISNDNQSIESGEVPSSSRDQQNNDLSQSQFSKDERINVPQTQTQQNVVKQTLTIIKQDRNQINNNNSNSNNVNNSNNNNNFNSNGKSINNVVISIAAAQPNNVTAPNPAQAGIGGGRVITIKKKDQGPKLIDKLIIKQKPSQNDLEKPTVSTGSLENVNLQSQSIQQMQPQPNPSNFSYKIQNSQIISRSGVATNNNGGLKTQKVLRISQRENDGNNSTFGEEKDYQLNSNNNKSNINVYQKREYQAKQDIYKNRYQINYNNEEKYNYNQLGEQQKQLINNNIQNYQTQNQNDFSKQKLFISSNQSQNQQINIQIQQQQQQNSCQQQLQQQQQIQYQQQQLLSQQSQQQSQLQLQQQQPQLLQSQQSQQFQNNLKQYQQYYSQQLNSNNQQYLNQPILNMQYSQHQQNFSQVLKVVDIQAEKKKLHKLIHERIKLVHLRHMREKKKKYHCLHVFHRINCHQIHKSQQNIDDQKQYPEYLRNMDFLQFCKYFRSKLERSSSLSIEREFFLQQPLSSISKPSKSPPQSGQNNLLPEAKQLQTSLNDKNIKDKIQQNNNSCQLESNQIQQQYQSRSKQKELALSGREKKDYSAERYQRENKDGRDDKQLREKSKDNNRDYRDNKDIVDFRDVKENRDNRDYKDTRSYKDSRDYKDNRDFRDNNRGISRELQHQQQFNYDKQNQYNKNNTFQENSSPTRSLRENNNTTNNNNNYQYNNNNSRRYYKNFQDCRRSRSRSHDSRSNSFSRNQYKGNVHNQNGKNYKNYEKKQNKYSPKHQYRNEKNRYFSRSTSPDSRKGQQQPQYQQTRYNRNDEDQNKHYKEDRKEILHQNKNDKYYNQDQRKQNKHNRSSHDNSKISKNQQEINDGETKKQNQKSNSPNRNVKQNQKSDQMDIEDSFKQPELLEQEIKKSTFSDVEDYKSSSRESQRVKPLSINQNSGQKQKYDEDQLDYSSDRDNN